MEKKIIKYSIWAIVLLLIVSYCYQPVVCNVKGSKITWIWYQADTWKDLRLLYPTEAVLSIDEEELLRILHQGRAILEFVPYGDTSMIPGGVVTLMISVSDGNKSKIITLGEWHRVTTQGSISAYQILNADELLNQVLDFLEIDENTGAMLDAAGVI